MVCLMKLSGMPRRTPSGILELNGLAYPIMGIWVTEWLVDVIGLLDGQYWFFIQRFSFLNTSNSLASWTDFTQSGTKIQYGSRKAMFINE